MINLSDLKGLTVIEVDGMNVDSDVVKLKTSCGREFMMFHEQGCCESVFISDVCGDVEDIVGSKIVHFEERTSEGDENSSDRPDEYCESFTWTFYDIQTTKGSVNIRWLGESNGHYSESVSIIETTNKNS